MHILTKVPFKPPLEKILLEKWENCDNLVHSLTEQQNQIFGLKSGADSSSFPAQMGQTFVDLSLGRETYERIFQPYERLCGVTAQLKY